MYLLKADNPLHEFLFLILCRSYILLWQNLIEEYTNIALWIPDFLSFFENRVSKYPGYYFIIL